MFNCFKLRETNPITSSFYFFQDGFDQISSGKHSILAFSISKLEPRLHLSSHRPQQLVVSLFALHVPLVEGVLEHFLQQGWVAGVKLQ